MTSKQAHALRQAKLRDAMTPLIGDSRFQAFMEEIAEQQKTAMLDSITDRVVQSERLLRVALGEVRAYQGILDLYHSFKEQAEERLEREHIDQA